MQKIILVLLLLGCVIQACFSQKNINKIAKAFPKELVHFVQYEKNPVFAGTGDSTWDDQIRERGYILREGNTWYLWYTGYIDKNDTKHLGYATSPDGITWTRYKGNPIYTQGWVEDMCVIKSADTATFVDHSCQSLKAEAW